ncbi:hypothetical protein [Janibacter melonis]|uniref:hypothetical protein n=1 Tax=Janibacter melonis TaxID=262209 RepID=UPI0017494E13|nr:hypothetical protein [Janibacter melonis]
MSTATDPDVDAIEALDFTPALPCEHPQHAKLHDDEAALYVMTGIEHGCPARPVRMLICASGWDRLGSGLIKCIACGTTGTRDQLAQIVEVLR